VDLVAATRPVTTWNSIQAGEIINFPTQLKVLRMPHSRSFFANGRHSCYAPSWSTQIQNSGPA
jgi:hypothetical protein